MCESHSQLFKLSRATFSVPLAERKTALQDFYTLDSKYDLEPLQDDENYGLSQPPSTGLDWSPDDLNLPGLFDEIDPSGSEEQHGISQAQNTLPDWCSNNLFQQEALNDSGLSMNKDLYDPFQTQNTGDDWSLDDLFLPYALNEFKPLANDEMHGIRQTQSSGSDWSSATLIPTDLLHDVGPQADQNTPKTFQAQSPGTDSSSANPRLTDPQPNVELPGSENKGEGSQPTSHGCTVFFSPTTGEMFVSCRSQSPWNPMNAAITSPTAEQVARVRALVASAERLYHSAQEDLADETVNAAVAVHDKVSGDDEDSQTTDDACQQVDAAEKKKYDAHKILEYVKEVHESYLALNSGAETKI